MLTNDIDSSGFVSSRILERHPLINSSQNLQSKYYAVLEYFVKKFSSRKDYADARLVQYLNKLAELENYATDKKLAEDRVKESELKLAWLKQINVKVESILEI